jgi:hypothetical protein
LNPKANSSVAFHQGKGASFLSKKKAGAVFKLGGPAYPQKSEQHGTFLQKWHENILQQLKGSKNITASSLNILEFGIVEE